MVSDALVKVILVALVGGAMVLIWRRWHDGVFLAVALIVEATVFVTASFIVDRDRPPVTPLDEPAPSGSFPSGHTAAAVAFYGGLFIVVRWHTRNRWVRFAFGVVAVAAPAIVGVSRVQRGMHHPVDVVAGIALGIASLFVVRAALARGVAEIDDGLRRRSAASGPQARTSPRESDDEQSHVRRRDRIAHRRTGRRSPSRPRHRRPARLGRQGRRLRLGRRARHPDRPAGRPGGARQRRATATAGEPTRGRLEDRRNDVRHAVALRDRHRPAALRRLASRLDGAARRELGEGMGDPRRLPRQRGHLRCARMDGDLVRPPRHQRRRPDRGQQGRAVHSRRDGAHGGTLARRRGRCGRHRRLPLLRRQGIHGVVPRRARARRRRSDRPRVDRHARPDRLGRPRRRDRRSSAGC